MILLHIGALPLASNSKEVSPWHRLAPQTRVACTIGFVFATALTANGHWFTWLIYGLGLILLILMSQVSIKALCQRVAVEFVFVGVVLLGTLFQPGGETLIQWKWIQITTTGLTVLGSVTLKTLLSLAMLNLLVLSTPIPALLDALTTLKMPPLLVAILASMYRYIGVLVDEFTAMQRAAAARNFLGRRRWHRKITGNMIGALFIRTYERGERIHQAMLARGFTGIPPLEKKSHFHPRDRWAVLTMSLFLLFGQALHWTIALS